MSWSAVIPLNVPARRKSRLSVVLGVQHRQALAEELYRHVLGCVVRAGIFESISTLSPALPPAGEPARFRLQVGPDLNAELARARALASGPLLVLNADLPLLAPEHLLALVKAAERTGCALAVDRHWVGTNAVALLPGVPFAYSFGPGSLAAHLQSAPQASVLRRAGLACDLDTPADIAHVLSAGRPLPERIHVLMRAARTAPTVAHAQ